MGRRRTGPTRAYLARDAGPHAAPNVHVYVGSAWEGELRLTAVTPKGDRPVVKYAFPGGKAASALTGLAIHDGLMVCSLPKQNELLLVDAAAGKVLGSVALGDPRGLAFDSQGRLLALVGKQLHRYRYCVPKPEAATLSAAEVLIASGLEDPQHVTLDPQGNFYVAIEAPATR